MTEEFDYSVFEQIENKQDETTLEYLVKKAEELSELNLAIEEMEDSLSNLKKHATNIAQKEIPELLDELGLKTLELKDGSKLSVKEFINGSLPKDPLAFEQAISWLIDNDLESIIKTDVTLKFGKGEEEEAKELVESLREQGYDPAEKYGVHAQTLASAIRELDKNGVDVPFELLGLYKGKKAEIKVGKK